MAFPPKKKKGDSSKGGAKRPVPPQFLKNRMGPPAGRMGPPQGPRIGPSAGGIPPQLAALLAGGGKPPGVM